jgi:DNA mismatch endonuclease (patch repair protein)
LAGSPDIAFLGERVAVFIDGDFWHGWRLPSWEHKLKPFWRLKLRENRKRDQRNFRLLRSANWKVIRLWGHEIRSDRDRCIGRILQALGGAAHANRLPIAKRVMKADSPQALKKKRPEPSSLRSVGSTTKVVGNEVSVS